MNEQHLTDKEHKEIFDFLGTGGDFAVRLAESILELKRERDWLLGEVCYYKPYQRLYMQSMNQSIAHSQEIIGTVFQAVLDPDSTINHGLRSKARSAS